MVKMAKTTQMVENDKIDNILDFAKFDHFHFANHQKAYYFWSNFFMKHDANFFSFIFVILGDIFKIWILWSNFANNRFLITIKKCS